MPAPFHPVRYRIEYVLLVGCKAFFCVLPHAVAQGIAVGLGLVAYRLMASRRREALRRLRLVLGPEVPEKTLRREAWLSFRNLVLNLVDMLRISRFDEKTLARQIPQYAECIRHLRDVLAQANGRGIILALPHCGNWDLAGSAVFLAGLPIFSVAGKQRNPYFNKLLNDCRGGHGMEILERGESGGRVFLQMLKRVRDGQIFAILPDSRSFAPALSIPFLGGEANLARGMGLLSWKANAPIVPLVMRRVSWRTFRFTFYPTLWPDLSASCEEEELRLTRTVVAHFDKAIRETPGQWFWYNKRWVLDPPQER